MTMASTHDPRGPVDRAIQIIERIAGILLAIATLLVVVSAIGRYGFARPLPDAFDLSRLILGVAIAWGIASLGYHGTHIKVDLLAQALPELPRRAMNAFAWAVLLIFTALLAWKIGERTLAAFVGGDVTMDLRLPHWPFFLIIWIGIVAALFTTAIRIWLIIARGRDLDEFDAIDPALLEDSKPK
ncbi:TRAP transporter small permease [Aquicoccus sp. G2-2]|uniref:TRAP transporter small permease n=1 Tax=Aquicoccus sp. G2-2 TaxID=3092120 RepID=UPI002AE00ABB|nr:TRAP transporter small permease [Aquicoccus sp. G2-2]MEA1112826.1 TRAP transporter small permease [Aquicoccus sp. G2-2]